MTKNNNWGFFVHIKNPECTMGEWQELMQHVPRPDTILVSGVSKKQLLTLSEMCKETGIQLVNLDEDEA